MVDQILEIEKIKENSNVLDNLNVIGNVGIGTTEPKAKLDVQGDIRINNEVIWLREGNDKNHGIVWGGVHKVFRDISVDGPIIFGNLGGALGTNHEGTQKIALYWNSNGKVGIGTTNPQRSLHLYNDNGNCLILQNPKGGSGTTVSLDFQTYDIKAPLSPTASVRAIDNNWSSDLVFLTKEPGKDQNGLKERLRITNDGNVGIGTTAPKAKLDVQGDIRAGNSDIYFTKTDHNHTGIGNTAGFAAIENAKNYDALMILGRAGTPKGRYVRLWDYLQINGSMDITGNVGIGTASPDRPLAILSSGLGQELVSFKDPNGNTKWHINQNLGGKYPGLNVVENGVADGRLFIKAGGNVGIGTVTPKYTLDVNGTINASADVVVGGGDCAEEFDIVDAESIEPGTVMVIDNNGALKASEQAYDKRVAGVISGAGDLRPGITLDKQANKANRLPLALNGKVYCKVDADCGPVEVGDLLTTSPTSGHAMKVSDHVKSIGAIIGKALRPLEAGCGLIPILVALQ